MNKKILFQRMRRSKLFVIGLTGVVIIFLMAIFGPMLMKHDPYKTNLLLRLQKPDWFSKGLDGFILGTDTVGRDILTRLVIGARYSLSIALIAVICTLLIGVTLGMIAGYFGGAIDMIIMRTCDAMSAIPTLMLGIAVLAVLGISTINLVGVMIITRWVGYTRLTRNTVMVTRNKEFVQASRLLGASTTRILIKEILPNITTPMLIQFSQQVGGIIMLEASLSYLNLGIQPPAPSWGAMISAGRDYIATAPWVVVAPGIFLMCTVLSFNFLGDGLRDILDVKKI